MAIAACLEASGTRHISTATLFEAFCAIRRPELLSYRIRLQPLLDHLDLKVMPFDALQLDIAQDAYKRFGRGSGHSAGLNMGDCYSYALAKSLDMPLLFKGEDFIHTDIMSALKNDPN